MSEDSREWVLALLIPLCFQGLFLWGVLLGTKTQLSSPPAFMRQTRLTQHAADAQEWG